MKLNSKFVEGLSHLDRALVMTSVKTNLPIDSFVHGKMGIKTLIAKDIIEIFFVKDSGNPALFEYDIILRLYSKDIEKLLKENIITLSTALTTIINIKKNIKT